MSRAPQPCPRCHTLAGWMGNVSIDGRICLACDEFSSNTEISRGRPWTEAEVTQMLRRSEA